MTLPRETVLTVEECRQVAARIALQYGARMTHQLVEEIEDLIGDVLIATALCAPKPTEAPHA